METDDPIAKTTAGEVRGRWVDGSAVFLGVPWAEAPVGELAFAAPQPRRPWDGVRDALEHGASAPQPDRAFTLIPEPVIPGDDCLHADVFTPDPDGSHPVLVFFHGGGFVAGCNASPWYDGTSFTRDGIVVVNVNYRLGIEGFLAVEGAPPNRGVLDWLAALAWVRDNVAAFGGDPDDVTIAGQSAGAIACATLVSLDAAAGLFHRAILMSGAGQGLSSRDGAARQVRHVADVLGVEPTVAGFTSAPAEARRAAVDGYEAAVRKAGDLPMLLGPVVDGDLITAAPLVRARDGHTDSVALLVGATAEEMNATFLLQAAAFEDDARLGRVLGRIGLDETAAAAYADAHREAHPGAANAAIAGQATTDRTFRAPAAALAEARAARGAPVHAYDFARRSPALGGIGAAHCLDVPFAFDHLDAFGAPPVIGDEPPQALADRMHAAWSAFVRTGDPGWPAYELPDRLVQVFDGSADGPEDTSSLVGDRWAVPRAAWPDPR